MKPTVSKERQLGQRVRQLEAAQKGLTKRIVIIVVVVLIIGCAVWAIAKQVRESAAYNAEMEAIKKQIEEENRTDQQQEMKRLEFLQKSKRNYEAMLATAKEHEVPNIKLTIAGLDKSITEIKSKYPAGK